MPRTTLGQHGRLSPRLGNTRHTPAFLPCTIRKEGGLGCHFPENPKWNMGNETDTSLLPK